MVQILKESVRNKIVKAAESQFAKEGFNKATMGAIAQEADVATGTIYKYFHNKQDLFEEVVPDGFVAEFLHLTQSRINEFEQPQGVDPSISYLDGEAGKLLHFWVLNRLKVIILLARSEGTKHESFNREYVRGMTDQAISQARKQYPQLEITDLLRFILKNALADSVRGLVSTLERFKDEKSIFEAIDAGTTYHLGGMAALLDWACKQRES